MKYDLTVRGGMIVDGTGIAAYRGDIGIVDGLIAHIGRIGPGQSDADLDASGRVVAPGFIDSHTHYDAQVFWNAQGSNSCWHGVTTVVMGNCGFTLAPNARDDGDLVIRNLEKSEDIPGEVLRAGIPEFGWETFGEYLATVDRLPKAINYAAYVGHSALRTWAMGERAFQDEASEQDLSRMAEGIREALEAGALGLSTSRTPDHQTLSGDPVSSRLATWDELVWLVGVLDDYPGAIVQFTREGMTTLEKGGRSPELEDRMRQLVAGSGAVFMFTVLAMRPGGKDLYDGLALCEDLNRVGRYVAHTPVRALTSLLSFKTRMPFDTVPEWAQIRSLPLARQREIMADPEQRARLVRAAHEGPYARTILVEGGQGVPDYREIRVVERAVGRNPSVGDLCGDQDPVDYIIARSLDSDFEQLFEREISNSDHEQLLDALKHRGTIIGASDAGAHIKQICNSDLHTYLLAYWVRETGAFSLEEGVKMCTFDIASAFGLHDRGVIHVGKAADLVIFDPDEIAPAVPKLDADLPLGHLRMTQRATGISSVIVNGEVTIADGSPTGARSGAVLRRRYR